MRHQTVCARSGVFNYIHLDLQGVVIKYKEIIEWVDLGVG